MPCHLNAAANGTVSSVTVAHWKQSWDALHLIKLRNAAENIFLCKWSETLLPQIFLKYHFEPVNKRAQPWFINFYFESVQKVEDVVREAAKSFWDWRAWKNHVVFLSNENNWKPERNVWTRAVSQLCRVRDVCMFPLKVRSPVHICWALQYQRHNLLLSACIPEV